MAIARGRRLRIFAISMGVRRLSKSVASFFRRSNLIGAIAGSSDQSDQVSYVLAAVHGLLVQLDVVGVFDFHDEGAFRRSNRNERSNYPSR